MLVMPRRHQWGESHSMGVCGGRPQGLCLDKGYDYDEVRELGGMSFSVLDGVHAAGEWGYPHCAGLFGRRYRKAHRR